MASKPTVTATFVGDSKSLEKAFGDVDKAAGNTQGFFDGIQGKALAVGAAITGLGAGLEAFNRKNQATNIQVGQMARQMDMSEGAVRKMATSLSNATFPLQDVLDLMQTGTQRGLEGKALEDYANFWDMVGDATGKAGPELAKAGVALESVGIAAGNESEALAAFGFITDKTTQDIGDFLDLIDKRGPAIREFGLGIDDTAALLGAMEQELGLTGRTARQQFEKAINDSDGSLEDLLAQLGLTGDQFDAYRRQVDESSTVIEENAAILAKNMTPLQRWKSRLDDLIFTHAGLLQNMAPLAPVMMAAGPAIGGVTFAVRGLSVAMAFLAANPVVLIIAGLAALALGLYIAYQRSETFRNIVDGAISTVLSVAKGLYSFFKDNWPEIAMFISGPFFPLVALATDAFGIRSALIGAFNAIKGHVVSVLNFLIDQVNNVSSKLNKLPGVNIPQIGKIGGVSNAGANPASVRQSGLVTMHSGGIVPGGPQDEVLALLRGGEEVRTPAQAGGGITIHVTGTVIGSDVDAVAFEIRRALQRAGVAI